MNKGKIFEQQFKKSVSKIPDIWFNRLNDGTSSWSRGSETRFQAPNDCDFEVFFGRVLFLLELKNHKGSSLPYSAIRQNQIEKLNMKSKTPWVIPGFLVFFEDHGRCFFLNAETVYFHKIHGERKSIPISFFEKYGIEISCKKLKVNYNYDIKPLFEALVEECESNDGNLRQTYCLQSGRI